MKFSYSNYELNPQGSLNNKTQPGPRRGFLLKVDYGIHGIGYADVFPWPEFGDLNLELQLEALRQGKLTQILEQSIWLAKRDTKARKQKINLLRNVEKVKNHFLVTDLKLLNESRIKEARTAGFNTFKIKVGRDPDEEGQFVSKLIKQNPLLVRLDFNGQRDFGFVERFFNHLSAAERAKIEYAEDPVPWDEDAWREISGFCPLALDLQWDAVQTWTLSNKSAGWNISQKSPFKVIVIKPARQDIEKIVPIALGAGKKIVVSSSLDHPLGVLHSLVIAGELKAAHPSDVLEAGCLSLKAYAANDFNARITSNGPYVQSVAGTGIGFDDVFAKVKWTAL